VSPETSIWAETLAATMRSEDVVPVEESPALSSPRPGSAAPLPSEQAGGFPSDSPVRPSHYRGFSRGAEVIDITENLNFNLGNVVKYVARAGRKTDDPREDLLKAAWYLDRELNRLG